MLQNNRRMECESFRGGNAGAEVCVCASGTTAKQKAEVGMNIKTAFSLAVIVAAVFVLVKMFAGSSPAVDEDLKYAVCDDNAVVVTASCPATVTGNYVIPPRLGGKVVTGIGREAFSHCEGLTSVTIPKGVTSIGRGAFGFCASLKSVEIPEGVTSIGERAFECCWSLKSVEIPEGVTNISHGAFALCTSLESVVVPMSVVEFGDNVFGLCSSLKSVKFGNDVFEFYKPLKDATDGFEKAKDEMFAVECEKLALERLRCTTGGKYAWEAYAQRNNCHSRYEGLEKFVANFELAVPPLSGSMTRVDGNLTTREELYRTYLNANESLSKRKFGPKEKDEFETEDEYKTRRKNEEEEAIELKMARDKALDEVTAFEKSCNPKVFRCSVNDFYVMKEALVFIPKTEWKYDAEERQFDVKGREFNPGYGSGLSEYVPDGCRWETVQGFRFSANSLPVIQFVKSKSIDYKYKVPDGAWEHPRMFKAYKQKHTFLLVHLGLCDFKVKGLYDLVAIMPWSHEKKKSDDSVKVSCPTTGKKSVAGSNLRDPSFGAVNRVTGKPVYGHGSCFRAIVSSGVDGDIWRKQQAALDAQEKLKREGKKQIAKDRGEALLCKILNDTDLRANYDPRMDGEVLFKVVTDAAKEDGPLAAIGIYADYETAEGRAEIEKVLNHFEETGGAYYRGFSKAVRRAMELEECEDASTWTYK